MDYEIYHVYSTSNSIGQSLNFSEETLLFFHRLILTGLNMPNSPERWNLAFFHGLSQNHESSTEFMDFTSFVFFFVRVEFHSVDILFLNI